MVKDMKQVYGYIRVSTDTQAEKGYGIDIQRTSILRYCQNNNLHLLQMFYDKGISGKLGDKEDLNDREGLMELLSTLNGTNTIVVMNTSRLWRDDNARILISRSIKKLGGDILSVEQPTYSLNSSSPNDYFINSIMEMLDQYDRMCINLRLSNGKLNKAKQGYKPGGRVNYGYSWNYEKKIEIIPVEAEIVKEIFDLALQEKSYQAIANQLNSESKLNRNDKAWDRQSVRNIVVNKFYAGYFTHQKNEIKGKHESIVGLEVWNKCNVKTDK